MTAAEADVGAIIRDGIHHGPMRVLGHMPGEWFAAPLVHARCLLPGCDRHDIDLLPATEIELEVTP